MVLPLSGGPLLPGTAQLLDAALVVVEFGIEEVCQVVDRLRFGLLDVLHPPQHVLARLLVFGLRGPELVFESEVFPLILLHLGGSGVVTKPSVLKLLACGLRRVMC